LAAWTASWLDFAITLRASGRGFGNGTFELITAVAASPGKAATETTPAAIAVNRQP
jgi:hypothetical protein